MSIKSSKINNKYVYVWKSIGSEAILIILTYSVHTNEKRSIFEWLFESFENFFQKRSNSILQNGL